MKSKRNIPHAHVPQNSCSNADGFNDHRLETVGNQSVQMSSAHQVSLA